MSLQKPSCSVYLNAQFSLALELLADMILAFNAKQLRRKASPEIYEELLILMEQEEEELAEQELLVDWLAAMKGQICA